MIKKKHISREPHIHTDTSTHTRKHTHKLTHSFRTHLHPTMSCITGFSVTGTTGNPEKYIYTTNDKIGGKYNNKIESVQFCFLQNIAKHLTSIRKATKAPDIGLTELTVETKTFCKHKNRHRFMFMNSPCECLVFIDIAIDLLTRYPMRILLPNICEK